MASVSKISAFVGSLSTKPEEFFAASKPLADDVRHGLKSIFDHTAKAVKNGSHGEAPILLDELHTEGFDAESIWAELQMQHQPLLSALEKHIKKLSKAKDIELAVPEPRRAAKRPAEREGGKNAQRSRKVAKMEEPSESEEDEGDESGSAEGSEDAEDDAAARARRRMEAFDGDEEEEDEEDDGGGDDDDEEAFLAEGDAAFARIKRLQSGRAPAARDDDDDEEEEAEGEEGESMEDVDLNAPLPEGDEEEEKEQGKAPGKKGSKGSSKSSKAARLAALRAGGVRYEDMYGDQLPTGGKGKGARRADADEEEDEEDMEHEAQGAEENGSLGSDEEAFLDKEMVQDNDEDDEEEEEEEEEGGKKGRHAQRRQLMDEDEPEEDDEDMDDEDASAEDDEDEADGAQAQQQPQTRHEREKAKKAAEIAALEADAISKKPWWMQGEVGSAKRPLNSLLSADLDVQQAVRAPPQVTIETTQALEELIKQRVADAAWDDPARKEARAASGTERAVQSAGEVELSTERPAGGLADVYAAEYAAKALGADPRADKTAALEAEAEALLTKVLHKLDALSYWQFTPKPSLPADMSVERSSMPALAMEEALPTAMSKAAARAPQEAYAPAVGRSGVLRSKGEKSSSERGADRAAKKAKARKEAKVQAAQEASVLKANPGLGNKYSKEKALQDIRGGSSSGVKVTSAKGGKGGTAGGMHGPKGDASSKPRDKLQGGQEYSGAAASVGGRMGNSTAFFTKLQDEARAQINTVAGRDGRLGGGPGAGTGGPGKTGSGGGKYKL